MGTHAKMLHRPGSIAPAPPAGVSPLHLWPAGETGDAEAALQELIGHCKTEPGDSLPVWYSTLCLKAAAVADAIAKAEVAGASQEATGQMHQSLQLAVSGVLSGFSKDQLIELAGWAGFEHPALACPADSGPNPLVHWLDPTCPDDAAAKLALQATALERYAALYKGETFAGFDLASLHAAEGTHGPAEIAQWHATVAQVDEARETLTAAADAVTALKTAGAAGTDPGLGAAVADLIAAENRLVTAHCPEYSTDLEAVKTAAVAKSTTALTGLPGDALSDAIAAGQANGSITAGQAAVLEPDMAGQLLRDSVHPDVRKYIASIAASRTAQLAALHAAHSKLVPFKPANNAPLALPVFVPGASEPAEAGIGQVLQFAAAAGEYLNAKSLVSAWSADVPGLHGPHAAPWLQPAADIAPDTLTKEFRAWGKHQDPGAIGAAAAALGLDHAEHASKVQALKYIAAHWDSSAGTFTVQEQVSAAASHTGAKSTPVPAALSTMAAAPATPAGFAAKHKQLVAALAQAKATTADIPPRLEPAAVSSFEFGKGTTAVLGGMHAKTVHTGPDGGKWLFKPDNQARGARAHAEAAASALLHAGGVPSIPVYAVTTGGKPGAIQPLVQGAKQLESSPSAWGQAEVDAIVRYHVAAWMVGDHDGKPDNLLRTPSGGLVPIDQGQAFKHYGSDKLDITFHPNATYGAERPVYHQVYEAHLNGGLAPGVTVNPLAAHPVIKQYEKMPDSQLRAVLHDTAYQGASSGVVGWIPAMRARAAKQHGISESAVTKSQIAEAFLDHACERKHGLRNAFTEFFTTQVSLPAGAALRHGG